MLFLVKQTFNQASFNFLRTKQVRTMELDYDLPVSDRYISNGLVHLWLSFS